MNNCQNNSLSCKICNNVEGNQSYELREMMFGFRESFHYFECGACGCLQIGRFPERIDRYYPGNYYSFADASNETDNQPIKARLLSSIKSYLRNSRARYAISGKGILGQIIYAFAPSPDLRSLSALTLTKQTKILDLGCGTGRLLRQLQALGFEHLLGADPYIEQTTNYASGLKILKSTADAIDTTQYGEFDVVMMHHSLEHVRDPAKTLESIFSLLKSDGTCLIRVPTTSSYAWVHYRENWVQADAPRHFFLFSIKSMEILANNAGFRIENIVFDSNEFQFWGSEQYKNNIPLEDQRSYSKNHRSSMFSKKAIREFKVFAKKLNQTKLGDQCIFMLKKRFATSY